NGFSTGWELPQPGARARGWSTVALIANPPARNPVNVRSIVKAVAPVPFPPDCLGSNDRRWLWPPSIRTTQGDWFTTLTKLGPAQASAPRTVTVIVVVSPRTRFNLAADKRMPTLTRLHLASTRSRFLTSMSALPISPAGLSATTCRGDSARTLTGWLAIFMALVVRSPSNGPLTAIGLPA